MNIKDLFGYNWYSRRRFLKSMAEIPWKTVVESCGASFDSIRDIFVHSLQAEHFWMRRLSGKSIEGIYNAPFTKYIGNSVGTLVSNKLFRRVRTWLMM